jgi:hypothetical protein
MFEPHQTRYVASQRSLARISREGDHPMQELGLIPLVNGSAIRLDGDRLPPLGYGRLARTRRSSPE